MFAAAAVHVAIAAPVRKSHLRSDVSIPRGPSHCTVELHGQGFPRVRWGSTRSSLVIAVLLRRSSSTVPRSGLPVACDQRCQRRLAAARRAVQDDRGGTRTPRPAGAAASPVAADLAALTTSASAAGHIAPREAPSQSGRNPIAQVSGAGRVEQTVAHDFCLQRWPVKVASRSREFLDPAYEPGFGDRCGLGEPTVPTRRYHHLLRPDSRSTTFVRRTPVWRSSWSR